MYLPYNTWLLSYNTFTRTSSEGVPSRSFPHVLYRALYIPTDRRVCECASIYGHESTFMRMYYISAVLCPKPAVSAVRICKVHSGSAGQSTRLKHCSGSSALWGVQPESRSYVAYSSHTCMHARVHACMHTYTHTFVVHMYAGPISIHTRIHAYTPKHAYIHRIVNETTHTIIIPCAMLYPHITSRSSNDAYSNTWK